MSVTTLDNGEKMNTKESDAPYDFCILFLLQFCFPSQVFSKITPLLNFLEISFPSFKKKYVPSSKNLGNNI